MVLLSTSNPVAVWKICFSSAFRTIPSHPALSTPPSCRAKCSFLVASRENVDFFLRWNHRAWRIWLWSRASTSEFPEWWRSLVFLSPSTGFSYHHSSHVIAQVTLDHRFGKTKWYLPAKRLGLPFLSRHRRYRRSNEFSPAKLSESPRWAKATGW